MRVFACSQTSSRSRGHPRLSTRLNCAIRLRIAGLAPAVRDIAPDELKHQETLDLALAAGRARKFTPIYLAWSGRRLEIVRGESVHD